MDAVAGEDAFLFTEIQLQENLKQKRSLTLKKWKCNSNQSRGCVLLVLLTFLLTYWLFLLNSQSYHFPFSTSGRTENRDGPSRGDAGEAPKGQGARQLSAPSVSSFDQEMGTQRPEDIWPHMNGKVLNYVQKFYSYKISFFDRVLQRDNIDASAQIVIGYFDGVNKRTGAIRLSNGSQCAFTGAPRSGEIFMECGANGRALSMEERPKCFYVFKVEDPELCHDDVAATDSKDTNSNSDGDNNNAKGNADVDVHNTGENMKTSNQFMLQERRPNKDLRMTKQVKKETLINKEMERKKREMQNKEASLVMGSNVKSRIDVDMKNDTLISNIKSRQHLESTLEFSETVLGINGHEGIRPCRQNPKLCGDTPRGSFVDGRTILPRITDSSAINMLHRKYKHLNGRTFVTSNPKRGSTISFELYFFHYVLEFTGEDDSRDSHLVGMFDGYDENGHMRLVNGDSSPRCDSPRSGVVVLACGQQTSVFVYSHSCEYQFTVVDPGACVNSLPKKSSLIFNSNHPHSHNAVAHHSVMHYEKFGNHLRHKSIESMEVSKDHRRKFKLKFFDKLVYEDVQSGQTTVVGYFNGIESFRRNSIRLSNGDFCAEIGSASSGTLIMKCGHRRNLKVTEEYPCVYHATFYDDDPGCSMLADNLW